MPQQDNDSLERFFRKATHLPDIKFNEGDWQKLRKRLDEKDNMGAAKYSARRKILAASLVVLFLSGLVLYFNSPDAISNKNMATQAPATMLTDTNADADSHSANQVDLKDKKDHRSNQQTVGLDKESAITDDKLAAAISQHAENIDQKRELINPASKNKSNVILERTRAPKEPRNDHTIKKASEDYPTEVHDMNTENSQSEVLSPEKVLLPIAEPISQADVRDKGQSDTIKNANKDYPIEVHHMNTENSQSEVLNPEKVLLPITEPISQADVRDKGHSDQSDMESTAMLNPDRSGGGLNSKTLLSEKLDTINNIRVTAIDKSDSVVTGDVQSKKNENPALSKWNVVLSLSPDFSSSRLSQYTAPGTTGGFMVHYQLTKRLSVGTGVSYSHKKYAANTSDYQVPAGYWKKETNGVVPNMIDGSCSLLDWRIKIQYKIIDSPRNRLYVASGVSSYYFLDEAYDFRFNQPNPGATTRWYSKSSSRNLFATANFSIAYEYVLNSRLAFGMEPGLNIPLQRIGWSNINLYSMGASVTLRYTFAK